MMIKIVSVGISKDNNYVSTYNYSKKLIYNEKKTYVTLYDLNEKLLPLINKKLVLLHVYGNGVITKKLNDNESPQNVLDNLKEFYYNETNIENIRFLSFIRKTVIEELFKTNEKENLFVMDVILGPIPLLITPNSTSINELDYRIIADDDLNIQLIKNTNFINENGCKTYIKLLVELMEKELFPHSTLTESKLNIINKYKQFYRYKRLLIFVPVFLVFLFLLNLFLQNYYRRIESEWNNNYSYVKNAQFEMRLLEEEKKRKLSILNSASIQGGEYLSFYIYEICKTVPPTIHLENIKVFPLIRQTLNNGIFELDKQVIIITGTLADANEIDFWLSRLSTAYWIKNLDLKKLKQENQNETKFIVELKLQL